MKILQRLAIYSVIVVSITTIFLYLPGYKNQVSPLGSVLSVYFYGRHATGKNSANAFMTFANHLQDVTDPALKKFYKKLNWGSKGQQVEYVSTIDTTWQPYWLDGRSKANYLQYWQAVRPEIKQFYDLNIEKVAVKDPVVHFRCSDAPFVTHPHYHISKAATVEWMAQQLKARGYEQIILLTCNKHRRVKNNCCGDLASFYSQIFTAAGIKVAKQCHDVYRDFVLMVNAPVLVSLNASSYAFMAGIAKDPHNYISSNLGLEHDGVYLRHTQADWIMDQREPLLHKDANGYANSREIIAKLQS